MHNYCIVSSLACSGFNPCHVINFVMDMYNSCSCSLLVLGCIWDCKSQQTSSCVYRLYSVLWLLSTPPCTIHNIYKMTGSVFPIILFTFISPVEHCAMTICMPHSYTCMELTLEQSPHLQIAIDYQIVYKNILPIITQAYSVHVLSYINK